MRIVFACVAVGVLSAASCVNQKFVGGVHSGYNQKIYPAYIQLLEERGKFTKKFFTDKLGQEQGEKLWKELQIAEFDSDTIRIRKNQADELKGLVEEALKE
jgi:hypothetical protein